jgi:hypothetical protein
LRSHSFIERFERWLRWLPIHSDERSEKLEIWAGQTITFAGSSDGEEASLFIKTLLGVSSFDKLLADVLDVPRDGTELSGNISKMDKLSGQYFPNLNEERF